MPRLRLILRQLWTLCVNHYTGGALLVVFGVWGFSGQWFSPGVSSRFSVFERLLASGGCLFMVWQGLNFFLKTWPSGAVIHQAIELVVAFTLMGVVWLGGVGFFVVLAWGALSHAWDSPSSLVERVLAIVFAVVFAGCGVSVLWPLFRYISRVYRTQGLYVSAEPLFRALAFWEKTLGPDDPIVATSLENLAQLYVNRGQFVPAEPLLKRILAIREKAFGPNHPDVATSLKSLADLYHVQRQYALAEPLYKRTLAIREKAFGPDHPNVATSLENIANLYRKTGRNNEAEALEKRAQTIRAIVR